MPFGDTFRVNLVATKPYNADFDGDEMNVHVTVSVEAEAELAEIMAVQHQIIGAQSSRPIMGLVQDALTGVYLMTRKDTFLTREQVMNLMMTVKYEIPHKKKWTIPAPAIFRPRPLWTGKQMISYLLPPLFMEKRVRGADADTDIWDDKERIVLIENGELLMGALCKSTIGAASGGIIHEMCLDYSGQVTCNFLSDIQRMINAWNMDLGFSIGLSDCIITPLQKTKIQRRIYKTMKKIKKIYQQVEKLPNLPKDSAEGPVYRVLSEILNSAGSIATRELNDHNHIYCTTTSGSKGSDLNVSQITACVGQQSVDGKRIALKKNNRSLAAFAPHGLDPRSRGFVASAYIQGLNPTEFFMHGMGGREGLVDTAVKSITGDTWVVVLISPGQSLCTMIGPWIDQQLTSHATQVVHYPDQARMEWLDITHSGPVMIPTVDATGQVSWAQITAVTRHDPSPDLYRFKTQSGRSVTVVASKSLLVWASSTHQWVQRHTLEVKVGDCLPVNLHLPAPPQPLVSIQVKNQDFLLDVNAGVILGAWWASGGIIIDQDHCVIKISALTRKSYSRIDLIGLLSASGMVYNEQTINDGDVFQSSLWVQRMLNLFGDGVTVLADQFPDFLYTASSDFLHGLLLGWCLQPSPFNDPLDQEPTKLHFKSLSMLQGWSWISNRLSLKTRFEVSTTSSPSLNPGYDLYLQRVASPEMDVYLDPVISIESFPSLPGQKVYDLTVPSTLNFGLANGLHVADTAETGYMQRRMMKAMESLKANYDQTVRDAQGVMVDFCYGGDGMDAACLEAKTMLKFLYMNQEQLKKYLFGEMVGLESLYEQEFQTLSALQRQCCQAKITNLALVLDPSVYLPVSISRVIKQVRYLQTASDAARGASSSDPFSTTTSSTTTASSSSRPFSTTSSSSHPFPSTTTTSCIVSVKDEEYDPSQSQMTLPRNSSTSSTSSTFPTPQQVYQDVKDLAQELGRHSLYMKAALHAELTVKNVLETHRLTLS